MVKKINPGEEYTVNIETYNETGSSLTKDFQVKQGYYNAETDTFNEVVGFLALDKTINPGYQTNNIGCHGMMDGGPYDLLVGYGKWHHGDYSVPYFFMEQESLIQNAIYVKNFSIITIWASKGQAEHTGGIVVAPNELFNMNVEMENWKDYPITKDYIALHGKYEDGTFTPYGAAFLYENKTINPGGPAIVAIPCQIAERGVYDIRAGYGNWDTATSTFTFEDCIVKVHNLIID